MEIARDLRENYIGNYYGYINSFYDEQYSSYRAFSFDLQKGNIKSLNGVITIERVIGDFSINNYYSYTKEPQKITAKALYRISVDLAKYYQNYISLLDKNGKATKLFGDLIYYNNNYYFINDMCIFSHDGIIPGESQNEIYQLGTFPNASNTGIILNNPITFNNDYLIIKQKLESYQVIYQNDFYPYVSDTVTTPTFFSTLNIEDSNYMNISLGSIMNYLYNNLTTSTILRENTYNIENNKAIYSVLKGTDIALEHETGLDTQKKIFNDSTFYTLGIKPGVSVNQSVIFQNLDYTHTIYDDRIGFWTTGSNNFAHEYICDNNNYLNSNAFNSSSKIKSGKYLKVNGWSLVTGDHRILRDKYTIISEDLTPNDKFNIYDAMKNYDSNFDYNDNYLNNTSFVVSSYFASKEVNPFSNNWDYQLYGSGLYLGNTSPSFKLNDTIKLSDVNSLTSQTFNMALNYMSISGITLGAVALAFILIHLLRGVLKV